MPHEADKPTGPPKERAETEARREPISVEQREELDSTGGRATDDPIAEMIDEGVPAGHPAGQLRGDQTEGHRGGSRRQTQNRGRD
jgi:hypothetical protein